MFPNRWQKKSNKNHTLGKGGSRIRQQAAGRGGAPWAMYEISDGKPCSGVRMPVSIDRLPYSDPERELYIFMWSTWYFACGSAVVVQTFP